MKEPSKVEVLNDINGDLVCPYRVVQNHLEEFCRQFKHALISRQMFEWMKMTNVETLTDIQQAVRFFYLQKMSFGGKVSGRTFGTATTSPHRLNLTRIEEGLSSAHLRLSRAYIEHLSWDKCINKYDRDHTRSTFRPTILANRGLWRRLSIRRIYPHGCTDEDNAGQGRFEHQ